MKKITLDFTAKKDKTNIHEYIALMLKFPKYYGKNLDALYDCLTDITEPTKIILYNTDNNYEYHQQLKVVFEDAAQSNKKLTINVK